MTNEGRLWALDFVRRVESIRARATDARPQLEGDLSRIVQFVRQKSWPRAGEIVSGIKYAVHGDGCLFASEDAQEIDVDFLEGSEIFDAWRVWKFVQSVDERIDLNRDMIAAACVSLVSEGILIEPRPGWFWARINMDG